MSTLLEERKTVRGLGKTPPFICIEDEEHTARCVAAIRRRKLREATAIAYTSSGEEL